MLPRLEPRGRGGALGPGIVGPAFPGGRSVPPALAGMHAGPATPGWRGPLRPGIVSQAFLVDGAVLPVLAEAHVGPAGTPGAGRGAVAGSRQPGFSWADGFALPC
jgi:hypothetical protein